MSARSQTRASLYAQRCIASALVLFTGMLFAQQSQPGTKVAHDSEMDTLPDAPLPSHPVAEYLIALPPEWKFGGSDKALPQTAQLEPARQTQPNSPGFPPISQPNRPQPAGSRQQHPEVPSEEQGCLENMTPAKPAPISCVPHFDPYQRFLDSSGPHPLTPRQKGHLAFRNVTDPFNFLTIGVESALSVASDPQSPYGPGVGGFGRNFGVAYTETIVSSFFGTFLIPVIAHQDPHYHRMPNASYMRRALHATTSVVWAQSDAGTGMLNYATIGNTAIGDALGNLYVPGRQRSWAAGFTRFGTALASDPIDNFITEFVPDLARHVNVQIVLIQRVVNEVERQNGGS